MKKQLRFNEFASIWKKIKIKNILKISYGQNQSSVENKEGNFPILGTGGEIGRTNSFLYDKPSVLIGRKGTINKPFYMDSPFWTVDTLFYTKIKEIANPKFVFYLFNTINWNKYSEQSGVPSLAGKVIENIDIYLPSLPEQDKIATFLNLYYKKIELQKKKIDLLENVKNGICFKLLNNKNNKTFKLSDLCKIKKGQQLNILDMQDNGKYPVYNGGIKLSGHTNLYNAEKNTISISEGGNSCGYVNFIEENFWSGGHNYTLINLKINSLFLYYILKFNEKTIQKLRVGSGLPNIQRNDLNNFQITLDETNMERIFSIVKSIYKKLTLENKKLKLLEKYKKGLLQQMFI